MTIRIPLIHKTDYHSVYQSEMIKKIPIIFSIARKEFLHIIRDPRSLAILFLMPIFQLIMFGYALRMEIQDVKIGIIDYSHSTQSRNLSDEFQGSKFFTVSYYDARLNRIEELFKSRKANIILIIPTEFDRKLSRDQLTPLQFLIDAADPNAATAIRQYIRQVLNNFNQKLGQRFPLPFDIRSTILYNPDKKSTYFFVPGLIALLLIMISALLTSITITREKESGSLEQILVSPIKSHQIIVGKVLPYIFLSFTIAIVILIIGVLLFKVPFKGSYLTLLSLSTLYIITALSLGLMISTIARTQQVAMMIALIATLLPTFILSGFIFPISSMPKILQYISYLIPARYYLLIVRGVILKGSSFLNLIEPTVFLVLMTLLLLVVSIKKFGIYLEK
jgi:ABC-2 type transport system permease protein